MQFGLKSFEWFKIMITISDQKCTSRSSISTWHTIINSQKFSQSNKDFFSLYKYVIDPVLSWFYKKLQKLSFIFL